MPKNYKKSFEIERKIERRSLPAERERNFWKIERERRTKIILLSKFSERTKALFVIAKFFNWNRQLR